jgi:hypothetical protein
MDFLDISSHGATYRYSIKIEQKFKHQNKWDFGSPNLQQPKYEKKSLTNSLPKTGPRHMKRRVIGRQRRTPKNGAISTKAPGTTPMNVTQNSHWWPRSKTKESNPDSESDFENTGKDRSSNPSRMRYYVMFPH